MTFCYLRPAEPLPEREKTLRDEACCQHDLTDVAVAGPGSALPNAGLAPERLDLPAQRHKGAEGLEVICRRCFKLVSSLDQLPHRSQADGQAEFAESEPIVRSLFQLTAWA